MRVGFIFGWTNPLQEYSKAQYKLKNINQPSIVTMTVVCKWTLLSTLSPCSLHPGYAHLFVCKSLPDAGAFVKTTGWTSAFCLSAHRQSNQKRCNAKIKCIMGVFSFWQKRTSQPFSYVFSSNIFIFLLHIHPSPIKALSVVNYPAFVLWC